MVGDQHSNHSLFWCILSLFTCCHAMHKRIRIASQTPKQLGLQWLHRKECMSYRLILTNWTCLTLSKQSWCTTISWSIQPMLVAAQDNLHFSFSAVNPYKPIVKHEEAWKIWPWSRQEIKDVQSRSSSAFKSNISTCDVSHLPRWIVVEPVVVAYNDVVCIRQDRTTPLQVAGQVIGDFDLNGLWYKDTDPEFFLVVYGCTVKWV